MSKKLEPFENSITSTLVGPLYGRAKYSQLYPDLLKDFQAKTLMDIIKNQYPEATDDFAKLINFVDEYFGLAFIIRAHTFDRSIKQYIRKNPEASVVNLGCGLDTTFSRVDNGKVIWYDVDLPEVIDYRRKLIPEEERVHYISENIFDLSWLNNIEFEKEKGIFLIAGGLFQYYNEKEISVLICKIAEKFPQGELIFDNPSLLGNMFLNRRLKKQRINGAKFLFHVNNPKKQILKWSEYIQLKESFSFFKKIKRNSKWKIKTRLMMDLCDMLNLVKFIHLKFTN